MPQRRIRRLSPLMINQIAAGEVVERPASVVKELVENAIDAEPTRIDVTLERGGIELIRVVDDGSGIEPEDLPLALCSHATSKIESAEDLDRIATMGFRGEALASIASVSRLAIRSRARTQDGASLIEVEGDRVSDVRPESGPFGTSVTVRNLFFNTPARRKFLRTPTTEQARCAEALRSLAMANPTIAFGLRCDGRSVLDLPGEQSARGRALELLGRELADQLLEVHADEFDGHRGLTLWGLAGLPAIARRTTGAQHVLLNGRPIRDRTIQHAIKEAYRGLMEPNLHPTAVLVIEMDPGGVDVNVHPAKTEVRFRDQGLVHSAVLRSVRDALRQADLTPTLEASRPPSWTRGPGDEMSLVPGPITSPPARDAGSFVEAIKSRLHDAPPGRIDYGRMREALSDEVTPLSARPASRVLQVHNSYLITQDEQGVVIIDQHALHERVMFEKLMARMTDGPLESQRLLTPAVCPATSAQIDALASLSPLLEKIGIEASPLGPDSIAVHSFPTILFDRGVEPRPLVTELLEKAESNALMPRGEEAMHEVLDMMACKAAVKAGDQLSDEELDELMRLRETTERSTSCPHGRPTSVRITIAELEKLFHRA